MNKIITTLALCMLLPSLGTSIANVALPTLAEAFNAPFQQVQWVVLAYLLATTISIVGAGRLGDVVGRRRLLLAGIVLFTAASFVCGAASALWVLIAARAAQGLGAAVMMALAMAFVGEAVPKARIGTAMGLLGTMSAVGTALGPSLGGVMVAGFGWEGIFFVIVPVGVLAFVLAQRYLPDAEARATSPSIPWARFRDPGLGAGLAMSALVSTVIMATLVVGPFHLTHGLALDTILVGIVMSAGPVVAALTGMPAGRAVDRFGAQAMTATGLAGMVAGCSALAMAPAAWGIGGYVIPLVVITASYALFQAANNTSVMKDVAPDQRGVVSGMLNLSRIAGLIAGTSAMGAIFVAGGMRVTFAVGAILVAAALGIAGTLPRARKALAR
jgi:MFS family permease